MSNSPTPAVRSRNLTIGYPSEAVVKGIEFELGAGQSLALIGMNGSGKSTLLKSIVGLLPPLTGDLEVLGERPGRAPRRTAYLSQFHSSEFILPLRAIDVVQMGRFPIRGLLGRMTREDDQLVREGLERMGVADLADVPLREMSGGQQQRTYLAQVLAHRADLLVLDEPTSGIDAAGKEIYARAMREELARGASLIMATHDIQEASACEAVMLLARRVIAYGPPQEVLKPEALLEAFGIVVSLREKELGIAVMEREHAHGRSEGSAKGRET